LLKRKPSLFLKSAGVALENAFTEAVDTIWKGKRKEKTVSSVLYVLREDGLESIVYNALAKLYKVFARFIEVAGGALGIERAHDVAEKITNKAKKFEKIADSVYIEVATDNGVKFSQNSDLFDKKHRERSGSKGNGSSIGK